uniref:Calpain catalytic domain-containing protein n=1 Tax=Psilocybe cubensis TaxID=181762 RepID=A0A8H7XM98_PSICU
MSVASSRGRSRSRERRRHRDPAPLSYYPAQGYPAQYPPYSQPPPPPLQGANGYGGPMKSRNVSPDGTSRAKPKVNASTVNTVSYAQQQLGVSITEGMKQAYEECKASVLRIAAQCRAKNRKFRDVDFDLENDRHLCLHNLGDNNIFQVADVRRVPELFTNPVFYTGTSKSAEIIQGAVEDCYLVSALSSMTSVRRLIDNLCVARDEEVGIYGFLFYRDCYWVPVIVDDLLFTRVPKYEQLSHSEKELYHFEKENYNKTARQGSDSLYFSRPATDGETWVPLVEKAYAKVHGDYASVMYGRTSDAIEDMTGGVSNLILTKDILNHDKFWHDELVKANEDRLFGCWFKTLDGFRSGVRNASVDGLVGNLSHSVVKAVEIRGKRFVVLRDPWGTAGWDGPWSDGSKEWTKEWLEILPELGHSFGGKGQFVMEYKDFLNIWQEVQRTLIFDDSWVMSSQWLHVSLPFPNMKAFSYGDINFSFSLPAASPVIIVLSKYNTRYFKDISGPCLWNLDFLLAKEGETEPIAQSSYSFFASRSVSVEMDLQAGNYIILARIDPAPVRDKDYFRNGLASGWDRRKLNRIMTERAKGQSIASKLLPTPASAVLASQQVKSDKAAIDAIKTYAGEVKPGESVTVTTTTTTTTVVSKNGGSSSANEPASERPVRGGSKGVNNITAGHMPNGKGYGRAPNGTYPMEPGWAGIPPGSPPLSPGKITPFPPGLLPPPPPLDLAPLSPPLLPIGGSMPLPTDVLEDDNSIVIGLKVYTKKIAPAVITGRLKSPPGASTGPALGGY